MIDEDWSKIIKIEERCKLYIRLFRKCDWNETTTYLSFLTLQKQVINKGFSKLITPRCIQLLMNPFFH